MGGRAVAYPAAISGVPKGFFISKPESTLGGREGRFMVKEEALARQSAAVPSERSVATDDAVTGHDDRDGIPSIRRTDGSHGGRLTETLCEFAVADGDPVRDVAKFGPDSQLEG